MYCYNLLTHGETVKTFILAWAIALSLSACGTIGGAVSGAGEDLSKAGQWIKTQ